MLLPGAVTPWTQSPFTISTSTQCDLSLYQVSLKPLKGFRRSCEDKVFFKKLIPRALTP
jgi:hypothetical protein